MVPFAFFTFCHFTKLDTILFISLNERIKNNHKEFNQIASKSGKINFYLDNYYTLGQ